MRKKILIAIYVFIFSVLNTSFQDRNHNYMVKIETELGIGSGVYIGSDLIITANHVITSARTINFTNFADTNGVAELLWQSPDYDIAILRTDAFGRDPGARLYCSIPEVGQNISVVGNPQDLRNVTAFGKVSSYPTKFSHWEFSQTVDVTIVPGMSGGPIFDEDKRVVGIAVGVLTVPVGYYPSLSGFGIIVPGTIICGEIQRMLDHYKNK